MKKYLNLFKAKTFLPEVSRLLSRLVPSYKYSEADFFAIDGANQEIINKRQQGLAKLSAKFTNMFPQSIQLGEAIKTSFSDLRFTDANRVPFQFSQYINQKLNVASIVCESKGPMLRDIDDNWTLDISGSYGLNVTGFDHYKECIEKGWERVKALGPVLGPLHPIVADNVRMLKQISGLDEVSFHMSGTEAVMAAVRSARFNTKRKMIVCFSGAYHGWWDGVQPGLGSERMISDCLTLKDMNPASLLVLKDSAKSIAGVLINPIQSFHPNSSPPNDAVLIASEMRVDDSPYAQYKKWLQQIRAICTAYNIPLIFDEVYTGFRLAPGGAQEYFSVKADMVIYGKTVAGGMPIGVVCGKHEVMKRFDEQHPLRMAYVVGTFSAHPPVMGAMCEFLKWSMSDEAASLYKSKNEEFAKWVINTNAQLKALDLPIEITHMSTIWTVMFKQSSRYHWMFQYYMRAQGLTLSWVGSGRCLVSFDYQAEHFSALQEKIIAAAETMQQDGWWWLDAENPLTDKRIKKRIMFETLVNIMRIPASWVAFVAEIMQRKHDDHIASHSNLINQFLHLISSTTFIISYFLIFYYPITAICLGFSALLIRQTGHALLEPPCHDKEKLLLGFTTRSKSMLVGAYLVIPLLCLLDAFTMRYLPISKQPALTQVIIYAYYWLLVTIVAVGGNVASLLKQYGFRTSMIWFVKLITDPITDVIAYYPSAGKLFGRKKSVPA